MKLVTVHYLGFTAMDRRFSNSMLPWIVSEIRKRDYYERVSLGMEDGYLQAYNADFELQFCHNVHSMSRFSQADTDPCTFLYLLRDDYEQLLYCYLFQAIKTSDVSDLYQQMKEHQTSTYHPVGPTRSHSSATSLTSLSTDISPSSSNFIEVLYIGKIKVWNKKVPDTFIDDALEKFKIHDEEKRSRLRNNTLRRSSADFGFDQNRSDVAKNPVQHPALVRSSTICGGIALKSPDEQTPHTVVRDEVPKFSPSLDSADFQESPEEVSDNVSPDALSRIKRVKFKTRSFSESSSIEPPEQDKVGGGSDCGGSSQNLANYSSDSESSTSSSCKYLVTVDDHNRTMVLQVGRSDLRLISPDRKLVLLHKYNRDISTCVQGLINNAHFGFICREGNSLNTFIGYVFKCESQSVAGDAVGAISQALSNADSKVARTVVTSCEHCPMVWYHKLCVEIENLTDRKTQAAILRKLDQLDDEEQTIILTKFRGAETDSLREQNEFLMMLLRAHCEMKQGRHVHDTAENRSEFLNQYLGGGTIFTKAKRTLTNSFDNLLKRKASRDDLASTLKDLSLPIVNNREASPTSPGDFSDRESDGFRSRSSTIGSTSDIKESRLTVKENSKHSSISPERSFQNDKSLKSPIMDIFFKVGSSPKSNSNSSGDKHYDSGSWRQAIFKRVATTNSPEYKTIKQKRSKEELRQLWQKSIHQAILLVRMEKENANIKAKQEENAVKRIKLEYDDMRSGQRENTEVWDIITNKNSRANIKTDNQLLLQAIRQGVPRGKRGDVWYFLAEHYCSKLPPFGASKFAKYDIPYEKLLKQLTSHQHAILIDLGRTFPSHSYYSSPLGPGQLALFNLLKAYSLLDPEVGYCQGLSFVAGVLLLHLEESQAFLLLRHLMFWRGLRHQYLPDMMALQVKLYQLSRLLKDQLPDLYLHFDVYEIAPTLYAAPWLLTLFASQFPLGFVARVFDLIFLENTDVVFRAALALLTYHKDALLKCENFEEIMNYLKVKLPAIDKNIMEKVMKQVCTTEISKQLHEYQVEYQVLQEELASIQPQLEHLEKLEIQAKKLADQNKALTGQLELTLSNVQRLEKARTLQQANVNRLEMHNRGLDVTVTTLATFVNSLIEQKIDVEIPDEIRRILSQVTFSERRKIELKHPQNNLLNMFSNTKRLPVDDKIMTKSLSAGKINLGELKINETAQAAMRSNSLSNKAAAETVQNTKSLSLGNKSSGSNPGLNSSGKSTSHFFSNSHNQILQQKLHGQLSMFGVGPKIDITVEDFVGQQPLHTKSNSDCTNISTKDGRELDEKSVSLPLTAKEIEHSSKESPTNSIDSGVGTPSSPRELIEPHPLSNCDVQFTFNGTRELKSIKGVRNNHNASNSVSSPDVVAK